jgi:hypothetical protein
MAEQHLHLHQPRLPQEAKMRPSPAPGLPPDRRQPPSAPTRLQPREAEAGAGSTTMPSRCFPLPCASPCAMPVADRHRTGQSRARPARGRAARRPVAEAAVHLLARSRRWFPAMTAPIRSDHGGRGADALIARYEERRIATPPDPFCIPPQDS